MNNLDLVELFELGIESVDYCQEESDYTLERIERILEQE